MAAATPAAAWRRLQLDAAESRPADGHADVVIDVVYDGADLAEVAAAHRTDIADGRRRAHRARRGGSDSAASHRVSPTWWAATRGWRYRGAPSPAPRCPPDRSALAGEFSGVYPRESPGGWQLIGHTDAVLWDVDRAEPALLMPGMWVRFRAV